MGKNRKTKAQCRAEHYTGFLDNPETPGWKALREASNWLLKEISVICDVDPQRAEAARWEYARQIAGLASRASRGRFVPRPGVTEDELKRLLDPWAKQLQGDGSR